MVGPIISWISRNKMADKIQHELRYFDKTVVFGHVEVKFEVDINSTMKIYPHAPTRSRFVPKKSLGSATSTRYLNRYDFGIESHVFISQHVFFPFSFVSLFTFIK